MNVEIVEGIGEIDPPNSSSYYNNTMAINKSGDIIVVSNDGTLMYSNIRNNNSTFKILPLTNLSNEEVLLFTNIEFDSDGLLLLLWSDNKIGYIEIPLRCIEHGILDFDNNSCCSYCEITDIIDNNDNIDLSAMPIVKVLFHPTCQYNIFILNESNLLRSIDLRSTVTEIYPLPANIRFNSFCFGPPGIDWLQFSILLLSSTGSIYLLCPVIPRGCIVDKSTVDELWSWFDSLSEASLAISRSDAYIDVANAYLRRNFGSRRDNEDDGYTDPTDLRRYVRAGETESASSDVIQGCWDEGIGENYNDSMSADSLLLSNYRPHLRGPISTESIAVAPLTVNSGTEETKQRLPASSDSSVQANDICVPGFRTGPPSASYRGSAPVLAVSYSDGKVEMLLIDAQELSPSFVGPSWKSIDLTQPQLNYPIPSLLVTESILLPRDNIETQLANSAANFNWSLIPDPVISSVVHVKNNSTCEVYLLNCHWLDQALQSFHNDSATGDFTSSYGNSGEEIDRNIFKNSSCVPTLVLPSITDGNGQPLVEDKLVPAHLCGVVVLGDALLGHVALVRTTVPGVVSAVNLSVHIKLCSLQETLGEHDAMIDSSIQTGPTNTNKLKQDLQAATNAQQLRWRHSQQLLRQVAQGLLAMPSSTGNTGKSSAEDKKWLLQAATTVEKDVINPLNELGKNIEFNFSLLQDELHSQIEILEGSSYRNEKDTAGSSAYNANDVPSLAMGVKKLSESLLGEQELLLQRVAAIQTKFEEQKSKAEALLTLAMSQRTKMSKAERIYKQQLQTWSQVVNRMNQQVETLQQLARPIPQLTPSRTNQSQYLRSTPTVNSFSSPMSDSMNRYSAPRSNQPRSGAKGNAWRPAGGMASIEGSDLTGSAAKQSPFATPSSIRSGAVGAPSPSFSANSRSLPRPPLSSVSAFAADRTPLTPVTPTAINTVQRDCGSPANVWNRSSSNSDNRIHLSDDDYQACNKLLSVQTELLQKAQNDMKSLQERLNNIKQLQLES